MTTIGTLTAVFDADTRRFDAGVRGVQTKITGVTKDIGRTTASTNQLTGALTPASTGLGGMSLKLGLVAGASMIAASAISAAAVSIHQLATFSQELGAEIFDLSQKVNFSAETLSSLKIAAELSGGSLASLSTSLGIFDRNLEEAKDSSSEISGVFRALNIDITDNEQALRQAFTALSTMKNGSQQTAIAMKLFGRSGKEVLGIVKESNGSIDDYIEKMREFGFVITSDGAKKADKFGDALTILQSKLEFLARQIGQELVPVVSKAADDISRWLKENQGEISKTAKEVGMLVSQFYELAKVVSFPFVAQVIITRKFIDDVQGSSATGVGATQTNIFGANPAHGRVPPPLPADLPTLSVFRQPAGNQFRFTTAADLIAREQQKALDALNVKEKKGGGGRGGGGAQKDILEGLKSTLMGLHAEFRKFDTELLNSANLTALAAEKEKLLADVMSSLSTATKMKIAGLKDVDQALEAAIGSLPKKSQAAAQALLDQALAQFKANEQTRISGELTESVSNLSKEWRQDIDNARSGADQYDIAIQNLDKAFRRYGMTLDAGTRRELEHAAAVQRSIEKVKELTRERILGDRPRSFGPSRDVIDLGGGSFVMESPAVGTRERIATVEEQVARERLAIIRQQMEDLASDMTSIFDRALYDGLSGGAKKGLQSLALGFLDLIQQVILGQLKNALAEALSGAAGSGGKGLLGKIFGIAVGGLTGGFAGGAGGGGSVGSVFSGAKAAGGPVSANMSYLVGERGPEMFTPHTQGQIVPNNKLGGTTINNNNFNFTVQERQSTFRQKRSQREMAEQVAAFIGGGIR